MTWDLEGDLLMKYKGLRVPAANCINYEIDSRSSCVIVKYNESVTDIVNCTAVDSCSTCIYGRCNIELGVEYLVSILAMTKEDALKYSLDNLSKGVIK